MAVRDFRESDREDLITLWQDCDLVRPWNDPNSDIDKALAQTNCEILVFDHSAHGLGGSLIVGYDGHRGWIYYLAVASNIQNAGWGKRLMRAAEERLKSWGCPKSMLMIRAENHEVSAFYSAIGYKSEDRIVMTRWLDEEIYPKKLPVTITYLEMNRPTTMEEPKAPKLDQDVAIRRLDKPSISFYRYLYNQVGEPWLWWEKRIKSDESILEVIHDEKVEVWLLSVGNVPAGFVELDFRDASGKAELAYFGLLPDFIGMKLGPYLLKWAINYAWIHGDTIKKPQCEYLYLGSPRSAFCL